jgi:hypothetical protein
MKKQVIRMDNLSAINERWKKSKLTPVLYHTTFLENAPLILKEQKIIANKGDSICKTKNGFISLSDRITQGIVAFFRNVIFEFDAVSLYRKNKSIAPKNQGSSSDIRKYYDEVPLFENDWVIPKELEFDLTDINKVLLITTRHYKGSASAIVVETLENKDIEYCFISGRWLSDNMVTDMIRYLMRIRGWKKFNTVGKYV